MKVNWDNIRPIIWIIVFLLIFIFASWLATKYKNIFFQIIATAPLFGLFKQYLDMHHEGRKQKKDHCLQVAINSELVKEVAKQNRLFANEFYPVLYEILSLILQKGVQRHASSDYERLEKLNHKFSSIIRKYEIWLEQPVFEHVENLRKKISSIVINGRHAFDEKGVAGTEAQKKLYMAAQKIVEELLDTKGNLENHAAADLRKLLRERLHINDAHIISKYIFHQAKELASKDL